MVLLRPARTLQDLILPGTGFVRVDLVARAPYISPRSGFTPHPLTTRAADHMVDLVGRASRFRSRNAS